MEQNSNEFIMKKASPKWANKLLRRRIIKYANVVRALSFQLSNFVQLTHFIYFSYFCFKQTIKTAYSSLLPILHACDVSERERYSLCEQSIFAFVDLFGSSVKPFLRVNRIVQQTIGSTAAAAIHCHLSLWVSLKQTYVWHVLVHRHTYCVLPFSLPLRLSIFSLVRCCCCQTKWRQNNSIDKC